MRPRTLLLLLVAAGCGLAASVLVSQLTRPGPTGMIDLPVAAQDIPPNTLLDAAKLRQFVKMIPFPPNNVPEDALKDIKDLENKLVGRTVGKNSPILKRDVTIDVLRDLDPGYRAITVRATQENTHHGLVFPGSRVDLMCITNRDSRIKESGIFLENLKVLACDAQVDKPEGPGALKNPVTLTLQVKPEEGQRMYWVSSGSVVGVLLRRPGDDQVAKPKPATSPWENEDGRTEMVDVVVAVANIDEDTPIADPAALFKLLKYQKDLVPPSYFSSLEALRNKRIYRYIAAGQTLTASNLLVRGKEPETFGSPMIQTVGNGPKLEHNHFWRDKEGNYWPYSPDGTAPRTTLPQPGPGSRSGFGPPPDGASETPERVR